MSLKCAQQEIRCNYFLLRVEIALNDGLMLRWNKNAPNKCIEFLSALLRNKGKGKPLRVQQFLADNTPYWSERIEDK